MAASADGWFREMEESHSTAAHRHTPGAQGTVNTETPTLVSEVAHGIYQPCAITAFRRLHYFP